MNYKLPIAAALAAASPAAATPAAQAPIRLLVERNGGTVVVNVVGEAQEAFEADYALEVSSPNGGGSNRSIQRGRARLAAGQSATFIQLRVSAAPQSDWSARLLVTPVGALPYEILRRGGDEPD